MALWPLTPLQELRGAVLQDDIVSKLNGEGRQRRCGVVNTYEDFYTAGLYDAVDLVHVGPC